MARIGTIVFANSLFASTKLCARYCGIFALTCTVAELLAEVDPAFQFLAAGESTTNFSEPTRLILEGLLSANAGLLHKKWALGAGFFIVVALMFDLRVTAGSLASTVVGARWRAGSTGLRWVEGGSAAGAADFVEDCFETAVTWPFVAELGAKVVTTFKTSSTDFEANMLGLIVLIDWSGTVLTSSCLAFAGFLLAGTATLTALVSSTI
jgi:hypothetical protein